MSDDDYRPVSGEAHTLLEYPCGLRAGDRLRLKADLTCRDSAGRPTGTVIAAGSIWTVLPGLPEEPDVVWLEEPDGESHTRDDAVWEAFVRA